MKLKWGCPKCGARGKEKIPDGDNPMKLAFYNLPAVHRNASPDCPVEHPDVGDEAYETAPGTAASNRLKRSGFTPRGTRGN